MVDDILLSARQRLAQALLGTPDDSQPATPAAQPFQWGSGGARMTADEIAQRRHDAAALMQQGTDASPLPTGTRGAGVWTQGLARVAKALAAGMDYREADQASKANAATNANLLGSLVGGASTSAPAATAPTASLDPETAGYINTAASKYGVDPAYLTRTAQIESGGKADATNPSGAAGLFQFMPKTAKQYGLDNPLDPEDSADAAARLTADNRKALATSLGRDPTSGELYLAHQQGAGGAAQLLANPNAPAAQVVGRDAVLQNGGTDGMTAGQFANQWTSKFGPAAAPPVAPSGGSGISRVVAALSNPYADDTTKKVATAVLANQLGKEKKDTFSQQTDDSGNIWSVNNATNQRTVALKAGEDPTSVREYEYYKKNAAPGQPPMDYATWSTAKARAGATNVSNNVDMGSGQTYDKLLAEGLGKSHAALSNGVEDSQTRFRDINAMQAAVDTIQKNGGTTGGMGQEQMLNLQKSINSGANALGITTPFNENDLSDKEMLSKLNRQIAGAQAKSVGGARVTNFELGNYINSNPGLSLSPTANQRLLGIQAQIEQRNIAVGNAIRNATAGAISHGQKIDPQTVQGIIETYDQMHPVRDPVNHQDLTQSYAIPDLQAPSSNDALAVGHETNLNGIRIKRVQ